MRFKKIMVEINKLGYIVLHCMNNTTTLQFSCWALGYSIFIVVKGIQ